MSTIIRSMLTAMLLLVPTFPSATQDFQDLPETQDDVTAINCELANEPFAELADGTTWSLREYLSENDINALDHCGERAQTASYSVSIRPGTNIRESTTTQSRIVAKGQAGVAYEVYSATEGNTYTWLEIRIDGRPAYVAQQLTVRLPDVLLEENGDAYQLLELPCIVAHASRRDNRTSLQPVIYGQSIVEVDVLRQSDESNLRLLRSDYDADTDGTYYRYGWQQAGTYTLQISLRGQSESVGFLLEGTKTHFLQISCE